MADGDIGIVFTDLDPDVVGSVTPSLAEIAAINRARSEDDFGTGQLTFNEKTIPTGEEVEGTLAPMAAKWVFDTLGPDVPEAFRNRARVSAAMYAAALVESTAHAPRENLIKLWTDSAKEGLKAIAARMEEVGAGGEEGPSDDELMPAYSFPCSDPLPPYA